MPAAYALSPPSVFVPFKFLFSRHSNSKVFVFSLNSMVIGKLGGLCARLGDKTEIFCTVRFFIPARYFVLR